MCAANKPPRPKGIKAWDIDRFDDPEQAIIYGWDFVGTQEEMIAHEIKKHQDFFADYLTDSEKTFLDKLRSTFYGMI